MADINNPNTVEADITVDMWLEKPSVSADRMARSAEETSGYESAGWIATGGLVTALVASQLIKRAAGPYGGIIELGMSIFKKATHMNQPTPESENKDDKSKPTK